MGGRLLVSCTAVALRMVDPRIPTRPGQSASGFHRSGRYVFAPSARGGGSGTKLSKQTYSLTENRRIQPINAILGKVYRQLVPTKHILGMRDRRRPYPPTETATVRPRSPTQSPLRSNPCGRMTRVCRNTSFGRPAADIYFDWFSPTSLNFHIDKPSQSCKYVHLLPGTSRTCVCVCLEVDGRFH